MYIVYNYPETGISEIVKVNNPDNLDLFITNGIVDVWENNPFNN